MNQKPSSTIYLSNLSYDRDRNGIRSMLTKFGQIKHIKIIVEPTTNQSRGMAFIEMGTIEEAKLAINGLDQKIIDGRTLKARFATPLKTPVLKKSKLEEDKVEKDLEYTSKQLAKKARNEAKRKSNPINFKLPSKIR
jgi:RNA recognition motif-containing protein